MCYLNECTLLYELNTQNITIRDKAIKIRIKKYDFREKLNETEETLPYNIGNRATKPRLKSRLPQDISLEAHSRKPCRFVNILLVNCKIL